MSDFVHNFGQIQRLVLFGGGTGLYRFAQAMGDSGLDIHVVTSPRHAEALVEGRPFVHLVESLGLSCLTTDTLASEDVLSLVTPDALGLSFGAAWIFKREFIERFGGRLVNAHFARLPRNRGAGGYSWRILQGDRDGACLLHLVDTGVDSGPIVTMEPFEYPLTVRKVGEFYQETLDRVVPFLTTFIQDVLAGRDFVLQPQDESTGTYFPRLNTALHGFIDWEWTADEIDRFICAFDDPYIGASTYIGDKRIFLKSSKVVLSDGEFHPFMAGLVYRIHGNKAYVCSRSGGLEIGLLRYEDGTDALGDVHIGDRLYTPRDVLEGAKMHRAVYTPRGAK